MPNFKFLSHVFPVLIGYWLVSTSTALNLTSCGITKHCIFNPPGCSQSVSSCLIFTYAYISTEDRFEMEMRGGAGGGTEYVAAAFSFNNQMNNADMYFCTGNALGSGYIIADQYMFPELDDSLPAGVVSQSAQTVDGVGECTFFRPGLVNKIPNTGDGSGIDFDLTLNEFYLLQATSGVTQDPTLQLTSHAADARYVEGPFNFPAAPVPPPEATTAENPGTTASSASATTTAETPAGADDTGCGETVGCFRVPAGCTPATSNCQFVSWVYEPESDTFDIEFTGGSSAGYLAVAFGTEPGMANADLYYCTQNGFFSGVIITQGPPPPATEVTGSNSDGIEVLETSATNGVLQCRFRRPASVMKSATDFNLATTEYYLLYASGGLSGASGLTYHSGSRMRTENTVNYREFAAVGGTGPDNTITLLKAHASLMLIAWLTCASIGIIIARHFKPLWHNKTLLDTKVWFQLHRGLMIAVLLCTVTAFIIVFVAIDGYSANVGVHPILGIIVTALTVINPTMALFRPHPGTKNRPIFNWAHWGVGTVARILAIVTIFFGVDLDALNLPDWDTYVLAGFVAFHVLTEIVLEIVSAVYGHIPVYKKPTADDKFDMGGDAQPPSDPKPKGSLLKYAILIIYCVVNLGFVITFIVFVAQN